MGKKGSPSAPAPVDPTKLVASQESSNTAAARLQQQLGMVNSTGPGGSVKYNRDPNSPSGYSQVTELDPSQRSIYDLGAQAQSGALGAANSQLGKIGAALGTSLNAPNLQTSVGPTDFTADREAVTNASWDRARSRLDPMFQQAEDKNRTRLSNQGLSQNSTAYNTSMDNFGRTKNDAYSGALNDAILQGANEQNTLFGQSLAQGGFANDAAQQNFGNQDYVRGQPIRDFASLLGLGGTAQTPTGFQGSTPGVAPADVTGAYALSGQQAQNQYQAKLNNYNSRNQAIGQVASAAMTLSDRRMKKDMTRIGERPDGIGLWTYRYNTDPADTPLRHGVMADEVEAVIPDAVTRINGIAHVDYGRL